MAEAGTVDFMVTQIKTGQRIDITWSRGGFNAGIAIDGRTDHIIKGAELSLRAGEPTTITVHFHPQSLQPQVGYFVSQADMADFAAWKNAGLTRQHRRGGDDQFCCDAGRIEALRGA